MVLSFVATNIQLGLLLQAGVVMTALKLATAFSTCDRAMKAACTEGRKTRGTADHGVRFSSTRYETSFLYVSSARIVATIVTTQKEIMYSDTGHDLLWAHSSRAVETGSTMPPAKTEAS